MKRRVSYLLFTCLVSVLVLAPAFGNGSPESSEQSEVSGELVILNWIGGSERDPILELEALFSEKYPNVTIKDVNTSAGGGDARAGIRAALLAGERFDVMMNTWPSFEKELIDAGELMPLTDAWERNNWGEALSDSWKNLAVYDGEIYGVYYLAGNRSGLWYNKDTFEKAGIQDVPKSFDEYIAMGSQMLDADITPVIIAAKSWAQTEWFENILLKSYGTDFASQLSKHEISWEDPRVKSVFRTLGSLVQAGLTADDATMLATHWPDASDSVLMNQTGGTMLIGTWANNRAANEYGMVPGEDYDFFVFPYIEKEFENTLSIDGKNWLIPKRAKNTAAAEAFISLALSKEGAAIFAKHNMPSPSSFVDTSQYDPIIKKTTELLATSDVFFVLDDLLPAELSNEFRVGLQKYLQDPTDRTIDEVTSLLESTATELY